MLAGPWRMQSGRLQRSLTVYGSKLGSLAQSRNRLNHRPERSFFLCLLSPDYRLLHRERIKVLSVAAHSLVSETRLYWCRGPRLKQMISSLKAEAEQTSGTEPATRRKVSILASHVVQYASPLFRALASDPRLDLTVVYCSLQGAESGHDPEFGIEIRWDEPLLDGYRWIHIPNRAWRPGLGRFFGLWNPGLWKLIRASKP